MRQLIGSDYLLTKLELILELDSDEEFEALNQGEEAFTALLDNI